MVIAGEAQGNICLLELLVFSTKACHILLITFTITFSYDNHPHNAFNLKGPSTPFHLTFKNKWTFPAFNKASPELNQSILFSPLSKLSKLLPHSLVFKIKHSL